jgi:hypothetical protein
LGLVVELFIFIRHYECTDPLVFRLSVLYILPFDAQCSVYVLLQHLPGAGPSLCICVGTCMVSDIFSKFGVFKFCLCLCMGVLYLTYFWDVGAVSCFPLVLVLYWCSVLPPVVFRVFCPVLAMLHFPEVLVSLPFTVPLLLRLCAVGFIGFLFLTVSWGLGSFSICWWGCNFLDGLEYLVGENCVVVI